MITYLFDDFPVTNADFCDVGSIDNQLASICEHRLQLNAFAAGP